MNPMTNMKNVQKLSQQELHRGFKTSWHDQYRNSAWIFIGGLPYDLTEGDIISVFSQYGEVVNINLVRDKDTGKQKGFCFVCYEDQRSTDLAVDNLNGIKILKRTIRVDHVSDYKMPKDKKNSDAETRKLQEEGCGPNVKIEKRPSMPIPSTELPNFAKEIEAPPDGFRLPPRLPIGQVKIEVIEEEPESKKIKVKKEKKDKNKKSKKKRKKKKVSSSESSSEESSSSEDESSSEEEKRRAKKAKKFKKEKLKNKNDSEEETVKEDSESSKTKNMKTESSAEYKEDRKYYNSREDYLKHKREDSYEEREEEKHGRRNESYDKKGGKHQENRNERYENNEERRNDKYENKKYHKFEEKRHEYDRSRDDYARDDRKREYDRKGGRNDQNRYRR